MATTKLSFGWSTNAKKRETANLKAQHIASLAFRVDAEAAEVGLGLDSRLACSSRICDEVEVDIDKAVEYCNRGNTYAEEGAFGEAIQSWRQVGMTRK